MKPLLICLATTLLCVGNIYSKSFQQKSDSLKKKERIQVTPNYYGSKINSLGSYGVITKDTLAFQTYAGLNVLNTLRGNMPNLSIGNDPTTISSTFSSLLVIDGVPLSTEVLDYYNLNSFEYESVYSFRTGNASTLYGGVGANGAFYLQSKNGTNFIKPTIEFNSTTSFFWENSPATPGLPIFGIPPRAEETLTQWRFSNSIAYMQDFGKIDTRVSYSYSALPGNSFWSADSKTNYHTLRINTGFDIAPRFNARLILDDVYGKSNDDYFYSFGSNSITSQSELTRKNIQGNLVLRYDPLDWLTLSSQAVVSKMSYASEDYKTNFGESYIHRDQQRTLLNLFTTLHKAITTKFLVNGFFGIQTSMVESYDEINGSNSQFGSMSREYTNESYLAGLGLEYNNFLFGNFNYRKDNENSTLRSSDDPDYYSYSVSFVFSEAFKISNSWFSSGKIRASDGKANLFDSGYPAEWNPQNSSTGLPYEFKKIFEAGVDLSFFSNRIFLTANYFEDKLDRTITPISSNTGFYSIMTNLYAFRTKGWEAVLGVTSISRNKLSMNTKVTWTTYETRLEPKEIPTLPSFPGSSSPVVGQPFPIITTMDGSPVSSSSSPEWYGSVLNQLNWKNFFTTFLINIQQGGSTYVQDFSSSSGQSQFKRIDGTEWRLRDISFGYRITPNILSRFYIRSAQISLSGKNLLLLYAKDEQSSEGSFYSNNRKSANLSLTLSF